MEAAAELRRRSLLVALAALAATPAAALATPAPAAATPQVGTLTLELEADLSAFHAAIDVLHRAAERFPGVAEVLPDLLFEDGDSFRQVLIEVRNVSAGRAGHLLISLDLSERLREIVAAARAGEVDRLRSYRIVQVHGGPHGK